MSETNTAVPAEPADDAQRGPRKWCHFRWRVLLVVPAAMAVVAAVYVPRQLAQHEAVGTLERLGATLRTQPIALPGVRELFGNAFSQEIVEIYLRNPQLAPGDLRILRGLSTLQKLELAGSRVNSADLIHVEGLANLFTLHLADTRVTDDGLQHLAGLTRLGILSLSNTAVSDAGLVHLARLSSLERLSLAGTRVTDAGLAHLQKLRQLKELSLEQTEITNAGLVYLKGMENLELLRLYDTKVTRDALRDLHAALPKCVIWQPTE